MTSSTELIATKLKSAVRDALKDGRDVEQVIDETLATLMTVNRIAVKKGEAAKLLGVGYTTFWREAIATGRIRENVLGTIAVEDLHELAREYRETVS